MVCDYIHYRFDCDIHIPHRKGTRMRHFIDLDTDQLMRLYTLLYDKRDMQDIVNKLHNHIQIVKQRERNENKLRTKTE